MDVGAEESEFLRAPGSSGCSICMCKASVWRRWVICHNLMAPVRICTFSRDRQGKFFTVSSDGGMGGEEEEGRTPGFPWSPLSDVIVFPDRG